MNKKEDNSWVAAFIIAFIGAMILIIYGIVYSCTHEEEEPKYRMEVVDKYETIGSNWHLIGGRASETEYHIIYKITPLNEEARKQFYRDKSDIEVSYIKYKDTNIGKTYIDKEYPLF